MQARHVLAVALVGAGCGGPAANRPVDNAATGPADPIATRPCPSADDLHGVVRATLTPPDDYTASVEACAPGRFGTAGWYVVARTSDEADTDTERHRLVLDPERGLVARADPEPIDFRSDAAPPDLTVADLDGDGADEVVEEIVHSESGITETYLLVRGVRDGRIVDLGARLIRLEQGDDGAPRCQATWRVAEPGDGGRRALVVDATSAAPGGGDGCLATGTHHFVVDGGRLVE